LSLDLQVSLQYKLQFENIGTLYHDFNMNYEQVFSGKVRSILINSAAQYRATELWMKRAQVGKHLQDSVDAELKNIYASCWGLQLMIIDLPDNFEEKLIRTEVQNQEILMRKKEQVAKNITAETSVIEASYARQATVMVSKGQANYSVVTQEAAARAKQKVLETEAEVSSILRSALGLRGEDLVRYQVYDALADKEESHFFFGFGGASVMSKGR
jgi:regulator of protease activity HflC (stomatin/prohibitin superfamily)